MEICYIIIHYFLIIPKIVYSFKVSLFQQRQLTWLDKLFQMGISQLVKLNLLKSQWHWCWISLYVYYPYSPNEVRYQFPNIDLRYTCWITYLKLSCTILSFITPRYHQYFSVGRLKFSHYVNGYILGYRTSKLDWLLTLLKISSRAAQKNIVTILLGVYFLKMYVQSYIFILYHILISMDLSCLLHIYYISDPSLSFYFNLWMSFSVLVAFLVLA